MPRPRIKHLPRRLEAARVTCRLKGKVYHARWSQEGRQLERSTKAQTEAGARAFMAKINQQLEAQGTVDVVDDTVTVQHAYDRFKAKYQGWRPCTWASFKHNFTARILPAFGPRPLSSITRRELRVWLLDQTQVRSDEPLSASSFNKIVTCLSTYFSWCCDVGGLLPEDANPAVRLGRQREPNILDIESDALTETQCDAVLASLRALSESAQGRSPYAYYIAMLAVDTGLRRGELWALDWDDIDFDRGTIRVDDSVDGVGTKTGAIRQVPMTSRVRAALVQRRETALGEPVVPRVNIRRSLNTAARKAGLAKFHFHGLRHTAATRWLSAGMDLQVVQKGMGHASIDMTRRYAKTRQTQLDEGMAHFDKMIEAKQPKLTVSQ